MKIVVNDTNILLDLISIDLFYAFFQLNLEFHTNDLILNEITDPDQKAIIEAIVTDNKLIVAETTREDITEIVSLMIRNLSFEDCSIWYYTRKINGILLTGDARLRRSVEEDNIEVRGILFIFDELVKHGIIEKAEAAIKLDELDQINNRLPKQEIEKRLNLWRK